MYCIKLEFLHKTKLFKVYTVFIKFEFLILCRIAINQPLFGSYEEFLAIKCDHLLAVILK